MHFHFAQSNRGDWKSPCIEGGHFLHGSTPGAGLEIPGLDNLDF